MSESVLQLLLDARKARKHAPGSIDLRQRDRLAEMVTFARANSLYYRRLYRDLPERVEDPATLPVTDKKKLMARFDDWATDRDVTEERVRAFVNDPDRVGEKFLGRYTVLTTSGTTGTPGIFVLDDRTMAVTTALMFRLLSAWLDPGDVVRLIAGRGRMTMVNAMGGHFASAVAATRLRRRHSARVQVLPVNMSLAEMVAKLNEFRPVLLAPYASVGALLAGEQEAGRLNIHPVLVVLSAEGLALGEYHRIANALRAKVRHSYAATECPFISYSCEHKWLHVNGDWVILEPVDAEDRPVPAGTQSHTVLISNLANRVQPILRYDLGDAVLERPDSCPCGNPLRAIRVQGRAADVVAFPAERDRKVRIAPLAFSVAIDRAPGIEQFQVVQTTPTTLRVRLRIANSADPAQAWQSVREEITRLLFDHGVRHVTIERAEEGPQQTTAGKFREVIPLTE